MKKEKNKKYHRTEINSTTPSIINNFYFVVPNSKTSEISKIIEIVNKLVESSPENDQVDNCILVNIPDSSNSDIEKLIEIVKKLLKLLPENEIYDTIIAMVDLLFVPKTATEIYDLENRLFELKNEKRFSEREENHIIFNILQEILLKKRKENKKLLEDYKNKITKNSEKLDLKSSKIRSSRPTTPVSR